MSQIMWAHKDKKTGIIDRVYDTRSYARLICHKSQSVVKVEVKEVKEKK